MRVLLDANIFISYLLSAQRSERYGKINAIVEAGFAGTYTLVFPEQLLEEIRRKVADKKYLIEKVTKNEVEEFAAVLFDVAELIPPIKEGIPAVTRDKKDDYLLAYALVGECDFLVSGDRDVLTIKQVGKLRIVRASDFYEILKKETE